MVQPSRGDEAGDIEATKQIRVVVVGGRDAVTEALTDHLREQADLRVVVALHTTADVRRRLTGHDVDVFLVGKEQLEEDGLGQLEELTRLHPRARIVLLAEDEHAADITAAVRAGASGWASYRNSVDELVEAVRGVARGETRISAKALTQVLHTLLRGEQTSHEGDEVLGRLTDREREVLGCLAEGLDRNQIAARLHVSSNTVRTHTQKVLTKLDVHSSLAAAAIARRYGIGAANGPSVRQMT